MNKSLLFGMAFLSFTTADPSIFHFEYEGHKAAIYSNNTVDDISNLLFIPDIGLIAFDYDKDMIIDEVIGDKYVLEYAQKVYRDVIMEAREHGKLMVEVDYRKYSVDISGDKRTIETYFDANGHHNIFTSSKHGKAVDEFSDGLIDQLIEGDLDKLRLDYDNTIKQGIKDKKILKKADSYIVFP